MTKDPTDTTNAAALTLLCAAQFVVVLDFSIVNVALPAIQNDLAASTASLQWIVGAYALTFGGFLLLGGRAADLAGRRLIFMSGLAIFSVASLVCGLAPSEGVLIGARAAQGAGAAVLSPAALSLISTVFRADQIRLRAFAAFAAAGSAAFAAGVVFGGLLTDLLNWRWIFMVNVPIGAVALAASPVVLPESRETSAPPLDLPGAVTATGGFLALIYALTEVEEAGWDSAQTIGLLAASVLLLGAFVAIQSRTAHALVPLRLFTESTVSGANLVMFLASAAFYPMFLLASQYMQLVLGFGPLDAGLAFVPMALATMYCSAVLSNRLVAHWGVRAVLVAGMLVMAGGLALLTQSPVDGSYMAQVLPATVIIAVGIGTSFTAILVAATARIPTADQGVASALINSSQQIGGAVGVAGLLTLAASRSAASDAADAAPALLDGYCAAFAAAAVIVVAAAAVAWLTFPTRGTRIEQAPARTGAGDAG